MLQRRAKRRNAIFAAAMTALASSAGSCRAPVGDEAAGQRREPSFGHPQERSSIWCEWRVGATGSCLRRFATRPDLFGGVGSGAQHHPAQELGEHDVDQL
jgi:hypothetical protein